MAQGGHRSFHTGWSRGGGWGGPDFGVSVGVGDYGWGDYGYYGPGVGVSFGVGTPGWGYGDWRYGSYAAAPGYGCSCASRYRSARIAPRYRYSSYAWGGYPYDYDAYYYGGYGGDYYGRGYASADFGWSDDGWRSRGTWRGEDRRFDRSRREDRVRVGERDFTSSRRDMRGSGYTRASFSERLSGEARTSRGAGEFRGSASGEIHGTSGRGGAEIRGTSGRGGGAMNASGGGRRNGGETR